MRIQHNIMAMNAYRNLTNNNSALSKNLEKLSSGYKINRAGDDAAGLAISEKMRAQITGLSTAQKNSKDAISLVQTAEGALTEVHDMLNRMVELATQSANGTYDNETDRDQMQKEVDQLRDEINRIADSSNFNGINLLDGNLAAGGSGAKDVAVTVVNDAELAQVTATTKGKYSIDLSNLGIKAGSVTASTTTPATITVNVKIGGTNIGTVTFSVTSAGEVKSNGGLATAVSVVTIDGVKFDVGVSGNKFTLDMQDNPTVMFAGNMQVTMDAGTHTLNNAETVAVKTEQKAQIEELRKYAQASFDLSSLKITDGATLKIGNTTYTFAVGAESEYKDAANVVTLTDCDENDADFAKKAAQALAAAASGNSEFKVSANMNNGTIQLTEMKGSFKDKGENSTIDYTKNDLAGTSKAGDGNWSGLVQFTEANSTGTSGLVLQIGDTADSFNQLIVNVDDIHCDALKIDGIDISKQTTAQSAIDVIKAAINKVSDIRGTLGATQNRLDHTINNLSVMEENITDAESTIRDTDIAEEMMKYTKNNILIQSAQAMLAQANQVPQGVLQLMG